MQGILKYKIVLWIVICFSLNGCVTREKSPITVYNGFYYNNDYICMKTPKHAIIGPYYLTSSKNNFGYRLDPQNAVGKAISPPIYCEIVYLEKGNIYSFNYQLDREWRHLIFSVNQKGELRVLSK